MMKKSLVLFLLALIFFIFPFFGNNQIVADTANCGLIQTNPTCVGPGNTHNYEICYEECASFCNLWPEDENCNGEEATHGCASLFGVGTPYECVCDNYNEDCGYVDGGGNTNYENCPKVPVNNICYATDGTTLGDIPPYIDCGALGGGVGQCCLEQEMCTVQGNEGECDSNSLGADNSCHIDQGGPCNPCLVQDEYPGCASGFVDNFWPRCVDEDLDGSGYCSCTSDEFFDDPNDILCWVNHSRGIYTAIGCIPIEGGDEFVSFILRWAIGIAGGTALILIAIAGIQIMTSAGNPQRLQAGKELLTAAITGFLFLLFSVYLLSFIGIDILRIPGL